MLVIPQYIQSSGIVGSPIQHKWDDDDPGLLYLEDERLGAKIAKICDRGVVALSAGTAEWIAWRLHEPNDNVLFNEIEAIWAGLVDWRYMRPLSCSPKAPERKDWRGPKRGPVCSAFYLLSQIVGTVKDAEPASPEASALSKLAELVVPNKAVFKEWRRFVIQRLSKLHPCVEGEELGPSIPRGALSSDFDYQPKMAKSLISQFLQDLDYRKNPFLASPEQMVKDGFEGTPYSF